ncbi:MAG: hypothetical protein M3R31_02170 [Pseudomonadota bacterium]|nr:hypothetical protein [Pseudomonadota bacterium]
MSSEREQASSEPGYNRPMAGVALKFILGAALAAASGVAVAEDASGTASYQAKSGPVVVTVKHAYLVKGPDEVTGKIVRRLVFSTADVASKIRSCGAMSCADGGIGEGMTVDLDAGPRLNYWFVANDQRVQHSGTADPASLKLTTDTPQRLAGKWDLDARAAGGPRVQLEFDAALLKEMKQAR